MKRGRRRFLIFAGLGTATAATLVVAGKWSLGPLRERYYRLDGDVPPGSLGTTSLRTLMAVVDTLIGGAFERHHYEDYFDWHARTRPGYRGLYARSANMVDRLSSRVAGTEFADLGFEERRRLLDALLEFHGSGWRKVWNAVSNREVLLFDRYVVQPVLTLYRNTDAWIHLGYPAWPGQPRGLDRYTRAPVVDSPPRRQGA